MGSRVTIYDIARESGMSTSTVSRVLNRSALVSEATSGRVRDAARRLGYHPRRIRRQGARTILHVVVFLPHARQPQSHLFYDAADLIAGIQAGFGPTRANLIVSLSDSTHALTAKKLGDIDGCIFAFTAPGAELRSVLLDREVPTVLINRHDNHFSCVVNAAEDGIGSLLGEIRLRRRADRICFVTVADARPVADYRLAALTALGADDVVVRRFDTVTDITTTAIGGILEEGQRVFMCVNDFVAVAVYERLLCLGLRVPQDVAVTGYDAAPVRRLLSRSITSIDLSVFELGRHAAGLLGGTILRREYGRVCRSVRGTMVRGDTL